MAMTLKAAQILCLIACFALVSGCAGTPSQGVASLPTLAVFPTNTVVIPSPVPTHTPTTPLPATATHTPTTPPPTATPIPTRRPTAIPQPRPVTLMFFHADWCPYCQQQKPIVNQLAGEYGSALRVRSIDIDDGGNYPIIAHYNVDTIPRLVVLNDAGQVVKNYYGTTNIDTLRSSINAAR